MEELKKDDFDPSAKANRISENPEPRSSMMDDYGSGGLGSSQSFSSSREEKRSNSSNVYGSTLGGEGINPFKIKDS